MSKKEDLTGNKYGKLTVKEMLYNHNGKGRTKCLCECECGNTCIKLAYELKTRNNPSCGCARKEIAKEVFGKDINGKKFGRLVVLETLWEEQPPKVKCQCDCGNVVILRKSDVQSMHTQSCGCLQKERASEANTVDHTGKISEYGVKIIKPYSQNEIGQWIWECECGICGKHFYDIPARILNNHVRSCGCMKQSSNELFIENILKENGIDYQPQLTFDNCKSDKGYPLFFDFGIFKGDELFCLIEYDGAQHFKANDFFDGEEGLLRTQKRDEMKNKYCKDNGITLYRFSYLMNNDEIKREIMNIVYP